VQVSIEIFNILGKKVKSLLNKEMKVGKQKVYWNGKNDVGNSLANGFYLYKIKAGNNTVTKKMLLNR
jgi:flagellar hook assembly protein FlgD